jgi:hypothetical protein
MTMTTQTQATRPVTRHGLELSDWAQIGALAAAASIAAVMLVQALALALWPEAAGFKPLDSYLRSALFTLVPALGATLVFAQLARRTGNPVPAFVQVAAVVLLVSFIPDYLLPDPNKTLLASSLAALLHLVAGAVTVGVLVASYRHKTGQCAAQHSRP